jgi:sodium/hydrogen antiporter
MGTQIEGSTVRHIVIVVLEEIGVGLFLGLALTGGAVAILRLASRLGWTSQHWMHIPIVALAALCFSTAQALGASGFIACFTGGLLFGFLQGTRTPDLLSGASSGGEGALDSRFDFRRQRPPARCDAHQDGLRLRA